jgi:hypothetical protein
LEREVEKEVKKVRRVVDGREVEVVGVPNVALVAVARK